MNGVFADILKACANWFLYIFIAEDAPLNSAIMKKRANQIAWLKRLDAINPTLSYADLYNIVYDGIVAKYGKTPEEILTLLYNTGNGTVTGIGESVLDSETEKAKQNLNNFVLETAQGDGTKKKQNFWETLNSVVDYIGEIVNMLGVNNQLSSVQPAPSDWYKPTGQQVMLSSLHGFLPYAVGAAIVYFMYQNSNNSDKRKKKK